MSLGTLLIVILVSVNWILSTKARLSKATHASKDLDSTPCPAGPGSCLKFNPEPDAPDAEQGQLACSQHLLLLCQYWDVGLQQIPEA